MKTCSPALQTATRTHSATSTPATPGPCWGSRSAASATAGGRRTLPRRRSPRSGERRGRIAANADRLLPGCMPSPGTRSPRSEEHTSELQSRVDLVCRLLLEKKKEDGLVRDLTFKNNHKYI